MKLADLIESLDVAPLRAGGDVEVSAVVDDSREAGPGALFVARPGTADDGRRFIADAVARGAPAVLAADAADVPDPAVAVVPAAAGTSLAGLGARLAERVHGDPSRRLSLVGVTGTNGKTTTAHLVHGLLNDAGVRCGLIGTVCVDDGRRAAPARLTTPGAPELSRLLAAMVAAGCRAAVMEVSSHALVQERTAGLAFAGAVFTNLSGDHLDYHGSMEAYAAAKARLPAAPGPDGWAVINADDAEAPRMVRACRGRVLDCRLGGGPAAFTATVRRADLAGTEAELRGPWGRLEVRLPLVGEHNVINALQATAVAHELGVPAARLAASLARCACPPGRLERVSDPGAPFTVLVDYAHTDDALQNVLSALRPLVPRGGRLRIVFGCGGDRDRTKRPRMAAAAWRFADEVIVTSDNPRTEDPGAIIDDILRGVPPERRAATLREPDRHRAIGLAVERCRPGDLLLVAGKGHEVEQILGTQRLPFDDRVVARTCLAQAGREVAVP